MSLLLLLKTLLAPPPVVTTYYVSSSEGDDSNDGLTDLTPWRTVQKVSETIFAPGDSVLFKRGDVWYGTFRPIAHFGSTGAPVTYGAYGTGDKPQLRNSIPKDTAADWTYEGGNLWSTYMFDYASAVGPELLVNGFFETGQTAPWELFSSGGASALMNVEVNPDAPNSRAMAFRIVTPASANNIIWYQGGFALEPYTVYKLSFYARVADGMPDATIPAVALGQNVAPFLRIDAEQPTTPELAMTTEFQLYERFFVTGKYESYLSLTPINMSDCRLIFALGSLPAGFEFFVDEVSLKLVGTANPHYDSVPRDVGHIRQGDKLLPWKYLTADAIDKMDGFVSDWDSWKCYVASETNPGLLGSELCMRWDNILVRVGSLTIEHFDLTYGGGNGVSVENVDTLTIQQCWMHHLGGSYLYNTGSRAGLRQGNGVNIWESASNIIVDGNDIWECYDVALTNQAYGAIDGGPSFLQSQITYSGNRIWACEQAFEIWGKDPLSTMEDVAFTQNICMGMGYGWSRQVRDDPKGFMKLQYDTQCAVSNVNITNNVFAFWRDAYHFLQLPIGTGWAEDNNLLIGRENDPLLVQVTPSGDTYTVETLFTLRDLAGYTALTGFEASSTAMVVPVPSDWGSGQVFSGSTHPGGYGSIEVSPPWGGSPQWLVISPPTSPRFG